MRLLLGRLEVRLQRHFSASCLGFELNPFRKRHLQRDAVLVLLPVQCLKSCIIKHRTTEGMGLWQCLAQDWVPPELYLQGISVRLELCHGSKQEKWQLFIGSHLSAPVRAGWCESNGNPCHWDPCRPLHRSCGLPLYVLPVMSIPQQGESHQDWEGTVKSAHGSTVILQSFPCFCSLEVDLQRPQGLLTAYPRTLLQEPGGTKL